MALGAATGALSGSLTDVAIDDNFIRRTRSTAALFLLSQNEVADRLAPGLKRWNPEIIATNLPAEKEARLRELFAENAYSRHRGTAAQVGSGNQLDKPGFHRNALCNVRRTGPAECMPDAVAPVSSLSQTGELRVVPGLADASTVRHVLDVAAYGIVGDKVCLRRVAQICRWSGVAAVLMLARIGFLHLTRGTAVRHFHRVGADGAPVGVSEPQFPLSIALLTRTS